MSQEERCINNIQRLCRMSSGILEYVGEKEASLEMRWIGDSLISMNFSIVINRKACSGSRLVEVL